MTRLCALVHPLALALLFVSLIGCDSKAPSINSQFDGIIQVEVLAVAPAGGNYVSVQYKVTNKSAEQIIRAKTDVTAFDASGAKLASKEGHFVVRSTTGGLAPGASLEGEVMLATREKEKALSAAIQIVYIRDGKGVRTPAEGADGGEGDADGK